MGTIGDAYVTDWYHHRLQVFTPDGAFVASLVGDAQQISPWAQTYIEANPDILKARRRVNLEPEWRFRRPVAVNSMPRGESSSWRRHATASRSTPRSRSSRTRR